MGIKKATQSIWEAFFGRVSVTIIKPLSEMIGLVLWDNFVVRFLIYNSLNYLLFFLILLKCCILYYE